MEVKVIFPIRRSNINFNIGNQNNSIELKIMIDNSMLGKEININSFNIKSNKKVFEGDCIDEGTWFRLIDRDNLFNY